MERMLPKLTVEAGHCVEVGGERLALALLKLFDQVLDILRDDLLSGRLLAAALRRICAVRRGGAAALAVAVVVATETHVFVLLFRRNRLSVLLTHGWEARRRLAEKNERSARRWESGGKSEESAKQAPSFGAQPRSERTQEGPFSARSDRALGRPPEGAEWDWRNNLQTYSAAPLGTAMAGCQDAGRRTILFILRRILA